MTAPITSTAHFTAELLRLADCADEQVARADAVDEAGQADGWSALAQVLRAEADDATRWLEWIDPDPVVAPAGATGVDR